MAASKQAVTLLQQDKTFFSKQVSDLSNKLIYADDRVAQLNEQLEKSKQSREELYEKYVTSRLLLYLLTLLSSLFRHYRLR